MIKEEDIYLYPDTDGMGKPCFRLAMKFYSKKTSPMSPAIQAEEIKKQILKNQEIVEEIKKFVRLYSDVSQSREIDPYFLQDIKTILEGKN